MGVFVLFLWGKGYTERLLARTSFSGNSAVELSIFFPGPTGQNRYAPLCPDPPLALLLLSRVRRKPLEDVPFIWAFILFHGSGRPDEGALRILHPFYRSWLPFSSRRKGSGFLLAESFFWVIVILLLIVFPGSVLFVQRFGLDQSIALFKTAHALSRQAPFYFYFIQIWGQFAPWSILLPFLGICRLEGEVRDLALSRIPLFSSGLFFFLSSSPSLRSGFPGTFCRPFPL